MSLEKYYGVALGDIRSVLSPSSFTYLTSILGGQSGKTSSFTDGDDLTSVGTISERICTNWSCSESSGRISSLILDMSESVEEGDGGGGGGGGFSSNYEDEEQDLSVEMKGNSFGGATRREEEGSNDDTEMMTGRNGPGENALPLTLPLGSLHQDHQNVIADKRHLNLSSLWRAGGISHTKDDALCSHRYPVCAKILAKTTTGAIESSFARRTRSVSVIAEKGKTFTRKDPNSPYALLVGKISDAPRVPSKPKPKPFVFGEIKKSKSKLPAGGVCNLSHPMSNPLYRVYHPKGYVKSEDELAREYIQQITEEFNVWLRSLEGNHVQLDTRVLTEILRDQLQLPSITSTIIPSSPKSSEGSLLQGQ